MSKIPGNQEAYAGPEGPKISPEKGPDAKAAGVREAESSYGNEFPGGGVTRRSLEKDGRAGVSHSERLLEGAGGPHAQRER